ncbi:MAG: hypothetical protein ACOYNS_02445 [Bacteroidota bacterium]
MITHKSRLAIVVLLATICIGCSTTGSGTIYVEPSTKWQDITIKKIAIIPNRLPMNIVSRDSMMKNNWESIKSEFMARKFEVVDYKTSVKVFEELGLPIEETKSSRDKLAELADQLGVDAIIIPYYGTTSETKSFLFFSTITWNTSTTFQIYLTQKNDFFARIDASGEKKYTSGIISTIGLVINFVAAGMDPTIEDTDAKKVTGVTPMKDNPTKKTLGYVGLGAMALGTIVDLANISKDSRSQYQDAFKVSFQYGLANFFKYYPRPKI